MKKILLQLDTDQHPSPFDSMVAYDVGVDEVLSYGNVAASDVQTLVQAAVFTRGPESLRHTAVWIGGADAALGERLLAEVQGAFFGPFRVSVMVDSNGCNTTAATAAAKLQTRREWQGRPAVVIGLGPVGRQMSLLLARAGHPVIAATLPSKVLGARFNSALSQSSRAYLRTLSEGMPNLQPIDATDWAALEPHLQEAAIVLACGPAGVQLLQKEDWVGWTALQVMVDFNLAAPAGIEGIKPADDFKDRDGKLAIGPVGLGNAKMKIHKACVEQMFERNDRIFDAAGIYKVACDLILGAAPE